jgi:hypothetical protein
VDLETSAQLDHLLDWSSGEAHVPKAEGRRPEAAMRC